MTIDDELDELFRMYADPTSNPTPLDWMRLQGLVRDLRLARDLLARQLRTGCSDPECKAETRHTHPPKLSPEAIARFKEARAAAGPCSRHNDPECDCDMFLYTPEDPLPDDEWDICEVCDGEGTIDLSQKCTLCHGTGLVEETENEESSDREAADGAPPAGGSSKAPQA